MKSGSLLTYVALDCWSTYEMDVLLSHHTSAFPTTQR